MGGPFADGIAGAGAGFDGIGLLGPVDGGTIVLVALRVAAGEGKGAGRDRQLLQPDEEVVGVGAGDVEADEEADAAVFVDEIDEALPEPGVALGGLGDIEFAAACCSLTSRKAA